MRGCRGEVPPSLEALGKGEGCALWVVAGSDTEWAVGTDGHPECLRGVSPAASSSNRRGAASRTFAEPGGAVCVRWPLPRGGDSCRPDPCRGEGGAVTPAQVGGAWPGLHPQAGRGRLLERMSRSLPVPSLIPGPTLLLHNWEQGAWLSLPGLWTEGGCICMLICMRSS